MPRSRVLPLIALLAVSTPALAQPGWGGYGGFGGGYGARSWDRAAPAADNREGKLDAERFLAEGAAAALGKGRISVKTLPGSATEGREQATYEAAVIDQLAKAGYDTATPDPTGGQTVEVTITHDQLAPEDEKRNPLSGSATMGVSNRGSMMALSLNYDATKPRGALIDTHVALRIRDRLTGAALYEARAHIATREGSAHWSDTAIATRLAAALFERFPSSSSSAR